MQLMAILLATRIDCPRSPPALSVSSLCSSWPWPRQGLQALKRWLGW